ncbi:MAG: hypothetical protein RSE46_10090 [Janthinobacterium sp.]|uniref:hypothetical protein n=1 Tax=Janthinobacterium sp. FT68W TaxID=2654255 RepID=UPI00126542F7|nr:hypothetical protein [Janthinobacterium sp. FT68W]KAB8045546.1 hypothetical protein GCN78_27420 [Janthinobacterium sp. FT68W]
MMFPLQESKVRDAGGVRRVRSLNLLQWRFRFCSLFHFAPCMAAQSGNAAGFGCHFWMSFLDAVRERIQWGNIFHFLASNVR